MSLFLLRFVEGVQHFLSVRVSQKLLVEDFSDTQYLLFTSVPPEAAISWTSELQLVPPYHVYHFIELIIFFYAYITKNINEGASEMLLFDLFRWIVVVVWNI